MSKIKQFSKALSILKNGLGAKDVLNSIINNELGHIHNPQKKRDLMMSALEIYDEKISDAKLLKLYSLHVMLEEVKDVLIVWEDDLQNDLSENRYHVAINEILKH